MQTTVLEATTEALLNRLEQDESLLDGEDLIFLQTAEDMMMLVRRYRRLKETNPLGAVELKNNSYLSTPMKWVLKNQCVFISEGSLQLLWDGVDITKNAYKHYNDPSLNIRKDSKLAVGEHPHPTKVLKDQVFEEAPVTTTVVFLRYILNRNIVSWTSALEDTSLRMANLNSETPDRNNVWSRYEAVGITTYPLNPKFLAKNGHDLKGSTLIKAAKKMKALGLSYEEFKHEMTY